MAGKDIPAAGADFTADGDADGSITIASTTPFRVGARAHVSDDDSDSVEVIIASIVSATVMKVRLAPTTVPYNLHPANYGYSDMSDYAVADNARIDMPDQFIYNEP